MEKKRGKQKWITPVRTQVQENSFPVSAECTSGTFDSGDCNGGTKFGYYGSCGDGDGAGGSCSMGW